MWRMYSIDGVLFVLHRITGIALFIYLLLHILSISTALLFGPEIFNKVMATFARRELLIVDLALFGSVLFHALNGLRIIAHERGYLIGHISLLRLGMLVAWVGMLVASATILFVS